MPAWESHVGAHLAAALDMVDSAVRIPTRPADHARADRALAAFSAEHKCPGYSMALAYLACTAVHLAADLIANSEPLAYDQAIARVLERLEVLAVP